MKLTAFALGVLMFVSHHLTPARPKYLLVEIDEGTHGLSRRGNAHKFCLTECGGLGGACERVCGEDGFCCKYAKKEHGCNGKEGGFGVHTCVTKKGFCVDKEVWCNFNPDCKKENTKENCPKTCGLCPGHNRVPVCEDRWDACTENDLDCTFPGIRKNCPKHCKMCPGDKPPAQEGEECDGYGLRATAVGGTNQIKCAAGLECDLSGSNFLRSKGICVKQDDDRRKSVEDNFVAVDKDGDKKVSLDEYIEYITNQMRENYNDEWRDVERKKVLGQARQKFNKADKNGDGYLDMEEFIAGH